MLVRWRENLPSPCNCDLCSPQVCKEDVSQQGIKAPQRLSRDQGSRGAWQVTKCFAGLEPLLQGQDGRAGAMPSRTQPRQLCMPRQRRQHGKQRGGQPPQSLAATHPKTPIKDIDRALLWQNPYLRKARSRLFRVWGTESFTYREARPRGALPCQRPGQAEALSQPRVGELRPCQAPGRREALSQPRVGQLRPCQAPGRREALS